VGVNGAITGARTAQERSRREGGCNAYAHFPMLVGIVLFAFAMKTIFACHTPTAVEQTR
jgi:hypothetical protein